MILDRAIILWNLTDGLSQRSKGGELLSYNSTSNPNAFMLLNSSLIFTCVNNELIYAMSGGKTKLNSQIE